MAADPVVAQYYRGFGRLRAVCGRPQIPRKHRAMRSGVARCAFLGLPALEPGPRLLTPVVRDGNVGTFRVQ